MDRQREEEGKSDSEEEINTGSESLSMSEDETDGIISFTMLTIWLIAFLSFFFYVIICCIFSWALCVIANYFSTQETVLCSYFSFAYI